MSVQIRSLQFHLQMVHLAVPLWFMTSEVMVSEVMVSPVNTGVD